MHEQRKLDHLRICLDKSPQSTLTTGFERYRFVHQALPEVDLEAVDLSCQLLGKSLRAPLIISCMTGGTAEAEHVNLSLAEAAQQLGLAMGVGSQRAALEDSSLAYTYQVRKVAPDILLLANLGAVQLNYGYGAEDCQRAVEMIHADALVLHLNPLQECLQSGGNTNFSSLVKRVEEVCYHLPVPVVVKEVGWGISTRVAEMLKGAGVAAIDVAGAGGTSWSAVEQRRAEDQQSDSIAEAFSIWGIPTAESIAMVRAAAPDVTVIGSGGIRSGIDVAKALALGAHAAGIATPLLSPATIGAGAVASKLGETLEELRIAMFCIGVSDLDSLRDTPLLHRVDRM
ncbi:MAG TPA: type 2 isopentenyl-diphosphate Delta-isomerase [Anaerolineae bacterium]|nr:type 2 isopentenyl-diphosphate Delta-isomerase [Anaerolineae bacterium]